MSEILKINHLSVAFSKYETFFKKNYSAPIEDLSLSLEENTITAVVGQSGSGKSLVAHAIMGMLPGNCSIKGHPLLTRYAGLFERERSLLSLNPSITLIRL